MPFIVTTKQPDRPHRFSQPHVPATYGPGPVSRRAVATLEEARVTAHDVIMAGPTVKVADLPRDAVFGYAGAHTAIEEVPESGGSVGPLPDGTVIEVERVSEGELGRAIGLNPGGRILAEMSTAEIIAAYNAKQAA